MANQVVTIRFAGGPYDGRVERYRVEVVRQHIGEENTPTTVMAWHGECHVYSAYLPWTADQLEVFVYWGGRVSEGELSDPDAQEPEYDGWLPIEDQFFPGESV